MRSYPDAASPFVADLHIHSKYSRACSRDLTIPNLAWWARRKGIAVLGTGDITHPAWREHTREHLRPAEPGLFRLTPELEREIDQQLPPRLAATDPARFLLSVEISTIYKRDGRTRKVHHLVFLPDFEAADRFVAALGRIGNLGSDGRPILGLDSRDLLEITLAAGEGAYLVPAHIWTPWFSALGSKSGFDAIADCYADLAEHIFAVETGLSSDPAMNHRVSSLDQYRLISCSDAHSPGALAREATTLTCDLDFFAIREALRTGTGLHGTIEFFPEEGKYHADGHRACGVNWQPDQTRAAGGVCPQCGKPLTVGVLSRVEDLADRPVDAPPPPHARHVTYLLQLPQVLGEINRVGPKSKRVAGVVNELTAALGSELDILVRTPVEEVRKAGGELLAEAVTRLRQGQVRRIPGFDGEYGIIQVFQPGELGGPAGRSGGASGADALFDLPAAPARPTPDRRTAAATATDADGSPANTASTAPAGAGPEGAAGTGSPAGAGSGSDGGDSGSRRGRRPVPQAIARTIPMPSPHEPMEPMLAGMEEVGTGLLDRLDAMQRVAASAPGGPMLVVAGPGTGKTRTLTHRIAYLCAEMGVTPDECLAITFTRRAAEELRDRLRALLGQAAEGVTVATFHALGLTILRENAEAAGLSPGFRVADEPERAEALAEAGDDVERYRKLLRSAGLVDLDELVSTPVELLRSRPKLADTYRERWPWVFVDEYQDVDSDQYALLQLLTRPEGYESTGGSGMAGGLCVIGDPDQAIYSFRGADVGFFLRFSEDYVDARPVRLTRSYRSTPPIIAAAVQAVAPSTLVPGRRLEPARLEPDAPLLGRYQAASSADEAQFVTRTIDALVGGVSHRSLDADRSQTARDATGEVSFSDIAVLYRTDAQSGPVLDALNRAGIPAQKRSHNRLRDRTGVAEIARELRLAGAGDDLAARVKAAGQALAQRYDVPTLDPSEQVSTRPADIWSAVELLMPLAQRCGDDLERFLAGLAAGSEVDALDPRAEAVTLLTIHAAKGLEFPIVFLVGVEDGLLPHMFGGRPLSDPELAEERRLFFVGLTRAQDRLFLSHANRPSRFLNVIDNGLFEALGAVARPRPSHSQPRLL